jgi:hypothetical protein
VADEESVSKIVLAGGRVSSRGAPQWSDRPSTIHGCIVRFVSGVLTCVFVGAVSLAVAEEPPADVTNNSAPAASAPAAAAASTPAALAPVTDATKSAAAAASPPAPAVDQSDKHFLAEGYKIQMRNGQKMFCRREEQLGSRLGGALTCNTAEELTQIEAQAKETVNRALHQVGPYPKAN